MSTCGSGGVGRAIVGAVLGSAVLLCGAAARGQCPAHWLPGDGLPGVGYEGVYATAVWDPDGNGPLPAWVVVSGGFTMAGPLAVEHIAAWDGTAWRGVGPGLNGSPSAFVALPSGELLAGGGFTMSGETPVRYLATWNGTGWSTYAELDGGVYALRLLPDGDVLMCGEFTRVNGVVANGVARREADTGEWSGFGAGISRAGCIAALPDGGVVVGGDFTVVNGVTYNHIARWDGAAWVPMGTGLLGPYYPYVASLAVLANGDVVAGGNFIQGDGVWTYNVARWNGTAWGAMGGLFAEEQRTTSVAALTVLPNGDLVAGGYFYMDNYDSGIARWNGTYWEPVGEGTSGTVWSISVLNDNEWVVGGSFGSAGDAEASSVARWNEEEARWYAFGAPGFDNAVRALAVTPDGGLVAGGTFATAGNEQVNFIARWDGATWRALGSGMNNWVMELAVLPNANVVATGLFGEAGGNPVNRLAQWDGESWTALGPGSGAIPVGYLGALLVTPSGDLLAAGAFTPRGGVPGTYVGRWNGSEWALVGPTFTADFGDAASVSALVVMPNGDIVGGGAFTRVGGVPANRIARWNGTAWSALGAGMGVNNPGVAVQALAVMPNGDLMAGGTFNMAGGVVMRGIARWNGTVWSRLGNGLSDNGSGFGSASELLVMPNGDLLVVGRFDMAGTVHADNVARWNGSTWFALDQGVYSNDFGATAGVLLPDGTLAVGGYFDRAGAYISRYFARFTFEGAPVGIVVQPRPVMACPFAPASFSVTSAGGVGAVTYQWRRNQVNLSDEAGRIVGAATAQLTILHPGFPDVANYDCVVSDACGNEISNAARLTYCATDFNCSGDRDSQDFFDYLVAFFAGDARADFNASGGVDSDDFFAFLAGFFVGCG